MIYKGNSIELGAKLGGSGGFNGHSFNANYCSQELRSLKDPLPYKGVMGQSRCNPRVSNSSSNKREDKSREGKDSRIKKKSAVIGGWKWVPEFQFSIIIGCNYKSNSSDFFITCLSMHLAGVLREKHWVSKHPYFRMINIVILIITAHVV